MLEFVVQTVLLLLLLLVVIIILFVFVFNELHEMNIPTYKAQNSI